MVNQSSSQAQITQLRDQGYVVVPRFLADDTLSHLRRVAQAQLAGCAGPVEFEADLQYPGAPPTRTAAGGRTVRRLLDAYARDLAFAEFATTRGVQEWMRAYFGTRTFLSRTHHNCLMTKHPRYGSLTGWHRDIRYWSFAREDLVSIWLALGTEEVDNGALWFVPGSHHMVFDGDRFDSAKFFRADRADNARVIETMESPRLEAGDAIFFHCNTLHSAGRNLSNAVKFSLVFTYHAADNMPAPGTRSASMPEVALSG